MRNVHAAIAFALIPLFSRAECKMPYSIAQRDVLGNVDVGVSSQDRDWLAKISKHYPDLCYEELAPNKGTWLYIDISKQADAAILTGNAVKSRESTVYTLKIGHFESDKLLVLRTFQRIKPGTTGGSLSGTLQGLRNSEHDVIVDALGWLEQQAKHDTNP